MASHSTRMRQPSDEQTVTLVPATVYSTLEPSAESAVRFTNVARRSLQTWSPGQQRALVRGLSKERLSKIISSSRLKKLRGTNYEVMEMADGRRVILSRTKKYVTVEAVFDRGFGPAL